MYRMTAFYQRCINRETQKQVCVLYFSQEGEVRSHLEDKVDKVSHLVLMPSLTAVMYKYPASFQYSFFEY